MNMTFIFSFALATGAVACTPAALHPSPGDASWAARKWPGTTVGDLEQGRTVFVSRCSSCHNLPSPDVKSPDEWAGVVGDMASGAKLSDTDRDLVLRYLAATSERLRHGG